MSKPDQKKQEPREPRVGYDLVEIEVTGAQAVYQHGRRIAHQTGDRVQWNDYYVGLRQAGDLRPLRVVPREETWPAKEQQAPAAAPAPGTPNEETPAGGEP